MLVITNIFCGKQHLSLESYMQWLPSILVWEIVSTVRNMKWTSGQEYFLCKHKALSSIPSTHIKKTGQDFTVSVTHVWQRMWVTRDLRISGVYWLENLSETVSPKYSYRLHQENKTRVIIEQDTDIHLWLRHMHPFTGIHIHAHSQSHSHTLTNL